MSTFRRKINTFHTKLTNDSIKDNQKYFDKTVFQMTANKLNFIQRNKIHTQRLQRHLTFPVVHGVASSSRNINFFSAVKLTRNTHRMCQQMYKWHSKKNHFRVNIVSIVAISIEKCNVEW